MAGDTEVAGVDRMSAQAELVGRIADIATRAAPGNEGVHLRFINQEVAYNDLSAAEIEARIRFEPSGGTALGQNLNTKVLKPLVYDVVDGGKRLARPLLILTITDGCPNWPDTFRDEIRRCGRYLVEHGYQRTGLFWHHYLN